MTSISERLANVRLEYVVAAVIVLFIARLLLGRHKTDVAKSAAEIVESVLIAVALVFLIIRPFVVQAFFIPSESMVPTLEISDHILVNKFVYRFQEPGHGDIVVFKAPPKADPMEKDFIKRLVGIPGDILEIKDGTLYRNGQPVEEPYTYEPARRDFGPVTVRPGELFVMGDNRNNSNDSREWGQLDRERVLGKAMVRFWPVPRMGLLR